MKQLLKDYKEFALIDLSDDNLNKLTGKMPYPGAKVEIHWNGDYEGVVDKGYAFMLPMCDEQMETDYFIHVPHPDNTGGKDAVEGMWNHLHDLLINKYIKKIKFT